LIVSIFGPLCSDIRGTIVEYYVSLEMLKFTFDQLEAARSSNILLECDTALYWLDLIEIHTDLNTGHWHILGSNLQPIYLFVRHSR
jgi:hypothetical protein